MALFKSKLSFSRRRKAAHIIICFMLEPLTFFFFLYLVSLTLCGCVQISFSNAVVLMCPHLPAPTLSCPDSLRFLPLSYLLLLNILSFLSLSFGCLFRAIDHPSFDYRYLSSGRRRREMSSDLWTLCICPTHSADLSKSMLILTKKPEPRAIWSPAPFASVHSFLHIVPCVSLSYALTRLSLCIPLR